MKSSQAENRDRQYRHEGHQAHRHNWLRLSQFVLALEHVQQREDEYAQHVHGEGDEKEEEEAIVPAADAVVDPRTVMIEGLFFLTRMGK